MNQPSALERVEQFITLGRIFVPPHSRLTKGGKVVTVDGYWRDAPDRGTFPEREEKVRASAKSFAARVSETPLAGRDGRTLSVYPEVSATSVRLTFRNEKGVFVGEASRYFSDSSGNDGASVDVKHVTFNLKPEYQRNGFGQAFIERSVEAYADTGVHKITVHAAGGPDHHGARAWAKTGFSFERYQPPRSILGLWARPNDLTELIDRMEQGDLVPVQDVFDILDREVAAGNKDAVTPLRELEKGYRAVKYVPSKAPDRELVAASAAPPGMRPLYLDLGPVKD